MLEITDGEKKEEFILPFTNVAEQAQKDGVVIPGSWVRMTVKQDHPLTYGMPSETGIFFRGQPLFSTSVPRFDMDRRVIGVFPDDDLIISGFGENEEKISDMAAMLWLRKAKDRLYFMLLIRSSGHRRLLHTNCYSMLFFFPRQNKATVR